MLDLHTLHFASAASRCAYVVVFLVTALTQRQQTFLWQWMGAMGTSMVGSLIMMQVPSAAPPVWIAVIVYGLYAASLVLCWTGLRSFFGRPVRIDLGICLTVLPGLLYPLLLAAGVAHRLALAAVFLCCLGVALLAAYETVRLSPGVERLWSQSIVTVAFGSYALVFVASIGILVATDWPMASAETARSSMILDQVIGVFAYFGYMAMAAERANRTLLHLAETDSLTGLSNRRGLQKLLRLRLPAPGRQPLGAVLILDLDHFKSINDRYGHASGDAVLATFAARLTATLRTTDLVARWGGEEFLVVLPGAGPQELLPVAERLRAAVAEAPFPHRSGALTVTVSIGVAMMGRDAASFEEATRQADAALYQAKAQGRNRVCCERKPAPAPGPVAGGAVGPAHAPAQADLRLA
ncbi:GGDEF domain-containing protein [Methylobacterium sp. V23]|uniref:GGDEF domain-containing protein n=1 Tax=Methylobacterium sp. V23 TaxID=2044878 RepID=UPI000CDB4608|nr:GGDEF domain-containing protein [Methylobacterium sp. V23]POR40490.1 GGDEF domain-containing protein [Methylobacterium sp. V23]